MAQFGKPRNAVTMGLLGVPGSGKSLTQQFLTGQEPDPELPERAGSVPDERFDKICAIFTPQKEVRSVVKVFDAAGVGPGSAGGLSNLYSSHGLFYICRAFTAEDGGAPHPAGEVDPVRDLAMLKDEIIKKDAELVQSLKDELEKQKRQNQLPQDGKQELEFLAKAKETLGKGTLIVNRNDWTEGEIAFVEKHRLLSAKAPVYLVNLSEKDFARKKNKFLTKIHAWIQENAKGPMIPYCAALEMKLTTMASDQERQKHIESIGAQKSMAGRIICVGNELFGLQHFFTCSAQEVRSWTVPQGARAFQAAGSIHPEMEKGLICVELYKLADLLDLGSEEKIKAEGKFIQKNRDYELEDADVIFFKFKLSASAK